MHCFLLKVAPMHTLHQQWALGETQYAAASVGGGRDRLALKCRGGLSYSSTV